MQKILWKKEKDKKIHDFFYVEHLNLGRFC